MDPEGRETGTRIYLFESSLKREMESHATTHTANKTPTSPLENTRNKATIKQKKKRKTTSHNRPKQGGARREKPVITAFVMMKVWNPSSCLVKGDFGLKLGGPGGSVPFLSAQEIIFFQPERNQETRPVRRSGYRGHQCSGGLNGKELVRSAKRRTHGERKGPCKPRRLAIEKKGTTLRRHLRHEGGGRKRQRRAPQNGFETSETSSAAGTGRYCLLSHMVRKGKKLHEKGRFPSKRRRKQLSAP